MAPHQSTIKTVEQSGHAIAQTHILYVPAAKKQNRLRNLCTTLSLRGAQRRGNP